MTSVAACDPEFAARRSPWRWRSGERPTRRVPCSEGARADPCRWRPVEPVAGPHPERGVEGVDVGGWAVGPVRPWRVRLGGEPPDEIVLPVLTRPDAGPGHEEPLVAGEAVEHGRRRPGQGQVVGAMGGPEADEVRDVLAEGEDAVDTMTGQGLVGVVLLDQEGGPTAILGVVRRRPPVA